jgi:hypothetical protein
MKPFHLDDLLEMILLLFRELESTTNTLAVAEESFAPTPVSPKVGFRSRLSA